MMSAGFFRVRSHAMSTTASAAILLVALSMGSAGAATSTGIDTTVEATNLPLAVNGVAVLTLYKDLSSTFAGPVTAPSYQYQSDARLKTDIHPIPHALDKLLTINGVEFNWKQDGRADMGVIAQDVAVSFPQLVHKDANGMMNVEYANLVGPMIEALRELKAENDRLKSDIKQIRNELHGARQTQLPQAVHIETQAGKQSQILAH